MNITFAYAVTTILAATLTADTENPTTTSTLIETSNETTDVFNSSVLAAENESSTQESAPSSRRQTYQPLVSTEAKELVLDIIYCGLLPVVCVFGIVGNVMSFVVLYIQGSKERTNIILVALAISDTLFLITTLLRKVNHLVSKVDKNAAFDVNMIMQAQVMMLNMLFGRITSALTMLIAIERFIAVYFPLKAQFLLTPTRVKFAVVFLYVTLCAAFAPLLNLYKITYVFSKRQQRIIPYIRVTQFYIDNADFFDVYLDQFLNIMFRYIPIVLVCVFTVLVVLRIKRSSVWRRKTSQNADKTKDEDRVTNMLVLVSCLYISCLMPGTITVTLRFFIQGFNFVGRYSNLFNLMGGFILLLECCNSSANFMVYMAMSKKFSSTYKRVFLCRSPQARGLDVTASQNTLASSLSTIAK
ncbi:probable G-protein coupled receptor B0563.6 [Haliotis rufescens]|uniref:probable G-protein coupled receptor B0563.6 n=1 Tax=Haliotis rufescens TaxID=6454 RepID=UPI00201F5A5B|nr:probable G-protein coupled receptor B0563.6 [Haliotis rufescens]